jgi:hypothetical protein
MHKLIASGRIAGWHYWIYLERSGLYTCDVMTDERAVYLTARTLDEARQKVREVIA